MYKYIHRCIYLGHKVYGMSFQIYLNSKLFQNLRLKLNEPCWLSSHLRIQLSVFVFLLEVQFIILIVKIPGHSLYYWPQWKRKWCLRDLSERTWGQAAAAVGRSLSWIPPPPSLYANTLTRFNWANEPPSAAGKQSDSQTRGDQNTSNILGDNVPPVSGSPTILLMPQRAGGCLLAEKQDETSGGGGGWGQSV